MLSRFLYHDIVIDLQDLDNLYKSMVKDDNLTSYEFYRLNYQKVKNKTPKLENDRLSINLNSLDKIDELKVILVDSFKVKIDLAKVESLKNYNLIASTSILLSICMIIFIISGICIYIFYYLTNVLYQQRKHLGTLMAFGISKKVLKQFYLKNMSIYLAIVFFVSTCIAYLGSLFITIPIGEGIIIDIFSSPFNIPIPFYFIFIVSLFIGNYISIILATKVLATSPGDLIKDRIS